ncbi:MAG: alpha/beta fold hydrolase [Thermodesulfobacteriota bacterium]
MSGFRPFPLVRNPHVQSILASSRLRVRKEAPGLRNAEERIVSTPSGARLLALFSRHPAPKGLIVLLHGWEGSSSSTYMIDAGTYFLRRGFSVCRLNLRDHGESHHLNEGLFHGALLDETFEAVDLLAGPAESGPAFLVGFSLGGNFALRIARRYSGLGRSGVRAVFAVSPPLDPFKTTVAIDRGPSIYLRYFLTKWKRSLERKQRLFPHLYRFDGMLDAGTCLDLTERIMPYFREFPTYRDYFELYTLRDAFFDGLEIPVTIFISDDDPVIPGEDYDALSEHRNLRVVRTRYGGHCGFIDLFPLRRRYHEEIYAAISTFFNVAP